MGTLCLVRHGQASFGAADCDQLSPLGQDQCERLGRHLRWQQRQFETVHLGSLRRHRQSLEALSLGWGQHLPPAQVWPGLNEYDGDMLVRALVPEAAAMAHAGPMDAAQRRMHFRRLRQALAAWMRGAEVPTGPAFAAFQTGVQQALEAIRQAASGSADVLVVSSGGPISVAIGCLLGLGPEATIDLNMRIRNSALTEWVIGPRRYELLSFNGLPHLADPALAAHITYA